LVVVAWHLADSELNRIDSPEIMLNVIDRNIYVGAAAIPNTTKGFAISTSAKGVIDVLGSLRMAGANSTLTLGGGLGSSISGDPLAAKIIVEPPSNLSDPGGSPADDGGRIDVELGTLRIRGGIIAIGQRVIFLDKVATGPLDQTTVNNEYFATPTSSLYSNQTNATPYAPPAKPYIKATTLSLMPVTWALLQNTADSAQPGGGIAVTTKFEVSRGDVNNSNMPTVAVFGSINGRDGVGAATAVGAITLNDNIPQTNVRINGCVALEGSGCIITNFTTPNLKLADPNDSLLVTSAPSLAVPFELITGSTNEALWRERAPADENCDATQTSNGANCAKPTATGNEVQP
jgi:hypothetical protein